MGAGAAHATDQHYLITEAGAVRSFEASAAGVSEYHAPDPDRVLHTNHPLAERQGAPESHKARENSAARLLSLQTRLRAGSPGLGAIQAALSSCDDPRNPVCRVYAPNAGLIGFTTGSMISQLTPRRSGSRLLGQPRSAQPLGLHAPDVAKGAARLTGLFGFGVGRARASHGDRAGRHRQPPAAAWPPHDTTSRAWISDWPEWRVWRGGG